MSGDEEIEGIRRKGKNYLISLSKGRELLVTRAVLDKYSLETGNTISKDTRKAIRKESDLQRAKEYAMYLLSRRSYACRHLAAKMFEKGYEKETVNQILSDLKEKKLVDDAVYARETVESILRHKPAGKSYIIGYLRKKYVARTLAESVVEELFQDVDEVEMAVRLLRSRRGHFSKFDLETARRKAYNYLSRRSISYRAAKIAFETVTKEDG